MLTPQLVEIGEAVMEVLEKSGSIEVYGSGFFSRLEPDVFGRFPKTKVISLLEMMVKAGSLEKKQSIVASGKGAGTGHGWAYSPVPNCKENYASGERQIEAALEMGMNPLGYS